MDEAEMAERQELERKLATARRVAEEAMRLLDELGGLPELRHRLDQLEASRK